MSEAAFPLPLAVSVDYVDRTSTPFVPDQAHAAPRINRGAKASLIRREAKAPAINRETKADG